MKWLLILSFLLISCTTKFVEDRNEPSLESGFYNGELVYQDKVSSVHSVLIDVNDNPNNHQFKFYAPIVGKIVISSERCGINDSVLTPDDYYFEFTLGDYIRSFNTSCSIVLSYIPEIDQGRIDFPIRPGYMTRINLAVIDYDAKLTGSLHERFLIGGDRSITIGNITGVSEVGVIGCRGALFKVPVTDGSINLRLSDLTINKDCLVRIGLLKEDREIKLLFLNAVKSDFTPLAKPSVSRTSHIRITGSKTVFLTNIDGNNFFTGNIRLKKNYVPKVIRMYTLKGRTIYCQFVGNELECER